MDTQLPIYQVEIDEAEGLQAMAFVDRPAIKQNWVAFAEQIMLAINDEKHIVTGPALIPEQPIYRNDAILGECYISFSAQTIEKCVERFMQDGLTKSVNLMHNSGVPEMDITLVESWIVNRAMNKQPLAGYEGLPDGTWFVGYKVNNQEVWDKVKDGTIRGFSIEGVFNMRPQQLSDDMFLKNIFEKINNFLK